MQHPQQVVHSDTPESDVLFQQIFGMDGEMSAHDYPQLAQREQPKPAKKFWNRKQQMADKFRPEVKSLATFSQLMTLAHNFNRRHGHSVTKGCNCFSCKGSTRK